MGLVLMLIIIFGVFYVLFGLILKKYKIIDEYYMDMVIYKCLLK